MQKRKNIIYWVASIWLALGMVSTAAVQLLKVKTGSGGVDSITALGYPVYFLTLLGVWKMLGAAAVLLPGFPLLKEWAYAGFFFAMSGAVYSHLVVGDSLNETAPSLLLLVLTVVSCYTRPASRKTISVTR